MQSQNTPNRQNVAVSIDWRINGKTPNTIAARMPEGSNRVYILGETMSHGQPIHGWRHTPVGQKRPINGLRQIAPALNKRTSMHPDKDCGGWTAVRFVSGTIVKLLLAVPPGTADTLRQAVPIQPICRPHGLGSRESSTLTRRN